MEFRADNFSMWEMKKRKKYQIQNVILSNKSALYYCGGSIEMSAIANQAISSKVMSMSK